MNRAESGAASAALQRARADARFHKALEEPTLEAAMAAYDRHPDTFWRIVKRLGVKEHLRDLYPEDMAELERKRVEHARSRFENARAVQLEQEREALANLIEDAEWLAGTGENQDGAAKRLGFKTWNALYNRLVNNGRKDLTDWFTANTEGRGRIPQVHVPRPSRRTA